MSARDTFSRRRLLALSGVLAFSPLAGCSTTGFLTPTPGAKDETAAALSSVNRLRQSKGLSALSLDTAARKAAAHQAARMAKAERMKHLIGFGDDFGARMRDDGVTLPAAENIASGQKTVEDAMRAWIESPRHLENMLGRFKGLGVAMARAKDGRTYWAMVLSG